MKSLKNFLLGSVQERRQLINRICHYRHLARTALKDLNAWVPTYCRGKEVEELASLCYELQTRLHAAELQARNQKMALTFTRAALASVHAQMLTPGQVTTEVGKILEKD